MLPIESVSEKISQAVVSNSLTIISCPTGSGKTVFVGKYLLEQKICSKVWVTIPRVLLAKNAKSGVETLYPAFKNKVGILTGKLKDKLNSPLVFCTEGSFINSVDKINIKDILLVDEVHEQGVNCSLVLLIAKNHIKNGGKVVLMSATMNPAKYLEYFECGGVIALPERERPYPTETLKVASMQEAISTAIALEAPCLFGFPGKGDIESFQKTVKYLNPSFPVYALHGECEDYQEAEIMRALESKRPCIIAATSVAMSGVTLPNLKAVLPPDCGKQIMNGVLTEYTLSKAEVKQWEGRVGRTCPGIVLNLADSDSDRPEYPIPEIQRVDVLELILNLANLPIKAKIEDLIDQPNVDAVNRAVDILEASDLLKSDEITELGKKVLAENSGIVAGMLIIAGKDLGIEATARKLAELHQQGCPFRKRMYSTRYTRNHHSEWLFSDHISILLTIEQDTDLHIALDSGNREFLERNNIFAKKVRILRRAFTKIDNEYQDSVEVNPELIKTLFQRQLKSLIFEYGQNKWSAVVCDHSGNVFASLSPVKLRGGMLADMATQIS